MKARIAVAVMCGALAGCADCGDEIYELSGKSVVAMRRADPYCYAPPAKETKEKKTGESWGVAKLLKASVHDTGGAKVAEIEDLLLSADGRVNTAILTVSEPGSGMRTISVPFKDLKRTVDANGEYIIRTSLLKEAQKASAPKGPAAKPAGKDESQQPSMKDADKQEPAKEPAKEPGK